jgi:hypothetical protein
MITISLIANTQWKSVQVVVKTSNSIGQTSPVANRSTRLVACTGCTEDTTCGVSPETSATVMLTNRSMMASMEEKTHVVASQPSCTIVS